MFTVHFLNDKAVLLTQLLRSVPAVGADVRIKGKKGKVTSVKQIDDTTVHVHVVLEKVTVSKFVVDNSKKKKR